jgi:serine/threonine protein kinase
MAANFDWKRRLGTGHFGEVWLALDAGLKAVRAVKLIHPSKVLDPGNFFHEAQILKAAEHRNVVRVEETGTLADGRVYVAMEYLRKGSLQDEAKGAYVDLTRAKTVMIDVLRGLEHAHSRNILHRDIKPANVLLGPSREGKLSDFGQAISTDFDINALGAKDYAYLLHLAPEVHKSGRYTAASDIYACGVTLYRLVNGDSYLPVLPSPPDIRKACIRGKFPDRTCYREFIPRSMRSLINKAMHHVPSLRYSSAEEMRRGLEQIGIHMNWKEQVFSHGHRWSCSWGEKCYDVTRTKLADGKWSVRVRKGRRHTSMRRMTAYCRDGLAEIRAQQMTRRILQNFVLGKWK